jgi:hypothetical protein
MWSWHWSPLTQTSLLLSPSDGLASFLETTLANGVKVVEKVITSKFRFHLIAIYALGCFRNFSCTPVTVPKLPWRAPTPVRLVKEWILMLWVRILIRRGVQHYVIKFVIDLRQVMVFSGSTVSSTNKTDCHDIFEILLKVVLSTIKQTNKHNTDWPLYPKAHASSLPRNPPPITAIDLDVCASLCIYRKSSICKYTKWWYVV